MQFLGFLNKGRAFQRVALWIGAALTFISLGMFAYLGTFTRFLADDYCDTVGVSTGSLLKSLIARYTSSSDRYSNFLFDALSERLFPHNVQVLPVVMILLWTLALIWLVREARVSVGLEAPFAADLLLGALLAFFPILEAPNRFQTIYWRSGMATHFAPLVLLAVFVALLLFMIRRYEGRTPAIWIGLVCLVIAFFAGGFSEPPDAMLVTASLLALAAVWLWDKGPRRAPALLLLAWTFVGGVLALGVMKFSPAMSFRLGTASPQLPALAYRTALYSLQFIRGTLDTVPLPTIFSILIPAMVCYCLFACAPALTSVPRRRLLLGMAVTPVLMYVLIAASFAPSVYGQAYPVERARFAGCLMMTTAGVFEGACLGMLAAQWQPLHSRAWLVNLGAFALVLAALYPLRATGAILQQDLPFAVKWSSAWDVRQAQIYADKAGGLQDIVVRQLPGFEQVKELDTRSHFWANRCAASFYGVRSISAPQMEYLH